jgi:hypothetical protein
MKGTLRLFIVGLGLCCAEVAQAQSFIIEKQFGQATGDTCQSYVLALALAFKKDPAFPMADWSELRKVENAIRAEVKKNMDARGVTIASGDDSRKALETFTNGKYTIDMGDSALEAPAFQRKIISITGVSSRSAFDQAPTFLAGTLVSDVIISGALRIAAKSYRDGHQFAILGVSSSVPNSSVEYLVLNSAARRKSPTEKQIDICETGVPDEKSPYFASLAWTNDIDFNASPGKMRAWQIVRK